MKIINNISNYHNVNYAIHNKQPNFQGVKEDLGEAIGGAFRKEIISNVNNVNDNIIQKLQNALSEIIKPQNILGKGHHGFVYEIDKNFVIKISRNVADLFNNIKKGVVLKKPIFKDFETYYGEDIMQIGNIHIKRNVGNHIPAGVPIDMNYKDIEQYYQEQYLPKFARVSQSSYDAVVRDFAKLNNMKSDKSGYYEFDSYNAANVVLAGDKLCLVDEIINVDMPSKNTTAKLVELLLFRTRPAGEISRYGNHINDAREIFHKIILASEKINLPYTSSLYDDSILKYTLEKCHATVDSSKMISDLVHIKIMHPILPERLKLVSEYLNEIMPLK